MSTLKTELLQELVREEQNLIAKEKEVERLQQICERRRNRVAAFKYLAQVLQENPIELDELDSSIQ